MIQTLDLFPQKIGRFRYEGDLSLYVGKIYEIKSKVKNFAKNFPEEIIYQTPFDLFSLYPEFFNLSTFIKNNIENHFNLKLKFVHSWANIYFKYGYSLYHTHEPSFCSGVFYLSVPKGDVLKIHNKHSYGDIVKLLPQNGDIIFFDGDQPHSTYSNNSNQNKISIAFNLMKS